MLGTVLEKLSALLPKNFIIAAFFPVLFFAGANGFMLYLTSEAFRGWLISYSEMDAAKQALYSVPALISIAFVAYVFSALNLSLRRVLEGESIPEWLRVRLTAGQRAKYGRQDLLLDEKRRDWWELKTREKDWFKRLDAAWEEGRVQTATPCAYSPGEAIPKLIAQRTAYKQIEPGVLDAAVEELAQELKKCAAGNVELHDHDYENKKCLNDDDEALRGVIVYATSFAEDRYVRQLNWREFNYSPYRIAPTALGNVAESARGYARSRYGINLDPFWLRLQKIVQDDAGFYAILSDAKTQLDFLVGLFWLTIVLTAGWLITLVYIRQGAWLFLAIGVAGPLLAFLWYQLALQNQRAFADVLGTAVDLYRFKLLDALHVERPHNSLHERQTWTTLNQLIGYGEDVDIKYARKTD